MIRTQNAPIKFLLVLTGCCLCLSGCKQKAPAGSNENAETSVLLPVDPVSSRLSSESPIMGQPSLAEFEELVQRWRKAVLDGNLDDINRLIDADAIAERCLEGLPISGAEREELKTRVANRLASKLTLPFPNQGPEAGSYQFVRAVMRGTEVHVIMRVIAHDGMLNYQDLRFSQKGDHCRVDDIYLAGSGASMSDLMRLVIAPTISSERSGVAGLSGERKQHVEDIELLGRLSNAINQMDSRSALDYYQRLSPTGKRNKMAMVLRLQAYAISPVEDWNKESDAAYIAAITEYEKVYPTDSALALLLMDKAALTRDKELALKAKALIDAWTGGDLYVNLVVASTLSGWGEIETAKSLMVDVDPSDFGIAIAHKYRLIYSLALRDHADTARQLTSLRDKYGQLYDKERIRVNPDFHEFVKSEEYQALPR